MASVMLSEDEMLEQALKASIADTRSGGAFTASQFVLPRSAVARSDRHVPPSAQEGHLLQCNFMDQFSSDWDDLIARYDAPSAICGYTSAAVALVLSRQLSADPSRFMDTDEGGERGQCGVSLEAVQAFLRGEEGEGASTTRSVAAELAGEVESAMAWVQDARAAWVAAHPADLLVFAVRGTWMVHEVQIDIVPAQLAQAPADAAR